MLSFVCCPFDPATWGHIQKTPLSHHDEFGITDEMRVAALIRDYFHVARLVRRPGQQSAPALCAAPCIFAGEPLLSVLP